VLAGRNLQNPSSYSNGTVIAHCSADTRYEEKLQEKGAQHKALEEALKDYSYGYTVTIPPLIIGESGSQYHTTFDALAKIGIEH